MVRKLYICSGVNKCSNTSCFHYEPHIAYKNCVDGHCGGRAMPCVPYVVNEFNLKLVIKND